MLFSKNADNRNVAIEKKIKLNRAFKFFIFLGIGSGCFYINAQAGLKPWLPALKNRTFVEGKVIKSPMKEDSLPVCLYKNTLFWLESVIPPVRNTTDRSPEFLDDFAYLNERRAASRLGKTATLFDKELDTRIYYSMTAKPGADGVVPVVDAESKGLYVYIHGSGTSKASGSNFSYKCAELVRLGYSCLSFDLPFHADGNQDTRFATTERFMNMMHTMVDKYRPPGKPVYVAGHSFGPEVAFEYAKRFPQHIDGIVALSPAAFNKDLENYFTRVTSQATGFWGDSRPNDLGGVWGTHATADFQWRDPKSELPDPTIANPKLKVVALTGDWEEYVPGPVTASGEPAKESRTYDICAKLKLIMKNIHCTKEPRVGHYIFAHKDEHGNDLVLRELLRVTQEDAAGIENYPAKMAEDVKKLKNEAKKRQLAETDTDRLAQRYAREPFFRQWMDTNGGLESIAKMISEKDQKSAIEVQKRFNTIAQKREQALTQNALNLKQNDRSFYEKNKDVFDDPNATPETIAGRYYDYLSELSQNHRERFRASKSVYDVPIENKRAEFSPDALANSSKNGSEHAIDIGAGQSIKLNMDIPPKADEVPKLFAAIATLRDAKRPREAQPINDYVRRWLDFKLHKGNLETWRFKPEALENAEKGDMDKFIEASE